MSPTTTAADRKDLAALELLSERDQVAEKMGLSIKQYPPSSEDADKVEKLLAEELERLSILEKEQMVFALHGIAHEQKDPEDIDALLELLEGEIRRIPVKPAYEQAKYLNEEFVMGRDFRLSFLRCDNFDIKLASQRIVKHFEVKKDWFGDGPVLARDIRISDLNEESLEALKAGVHQLLPVRDVAGRLVIFNAPFLRPPSISDQALIRALFYFFMTLARDPDVQQKGFVFVSWWSGMSLKSFEKPFSWFKSLKCIRVAVPRKLSGAHICIDNEYLRPVVQAVRWVLREDWQSLIRTHCGNVETTKFELQTFGIPTDNLPFNPDGSPNAENHLQWIQSRQKLEERMNGNNTSLSDIIVPRRFDVLFGRGHQTRNHTGNVRAAHIADMFRDKYEAAGKYEKTAIAERIVAIIRESQGRFLKWEDDEWVEVDRQTARNKISHFYRNTRNKHADNTNNKEETPILPIFSNSSTTVACTSVATKRTPSPDMWDRALQKKITFSG